MLNLSIEEIYDEHNGLVYNLCLNYLQNIEDAEEVTQDVFVTIFKKQEEFKSNSSLKTWIYRITVNHCLDFLKAKKRKKRFGFIIPIYDNSESYSYSDFNHPGIILENREATEKLLKLINELPDNQKTALILKIIDELSQKEIAEVMDLSVKAVESLLSRAKNNLKEKIKQSEGYNN
ncbi:RNA polymerase sigma factor [Vicingus serpentipes]|uniref:RNA polymerase sigma factor n=1 Tax=Vicingus serpentipes TaxID=1926625 RepID=A0A5C6RVI4_9FLAO|nr:RNA polymerase sigma factor [Vicingus serpentipes]TXB65899.1 RNA polymerase sigma factor [Vicingus serpentipes]